MSSLLYRMNDFFGGGGTTERKGGSGEWLGVEGGLLVALPC